MVAEHSCAVPRKTMDDWFPANATNRDDEDSSRQDAFHGAETQEEDFALQTFTYASSELPAGAKMTAKIPPAWAGGEASSWFSYEESVNDWIDVCSLDPEKRGPALRARLEGAALTYKSVLDREKLKEPGGWQYFLETLRPYFVRGSEHVFLYRLLRFLSFKRRGMDYGP